MFNLVISTAYNINCKTIFYNKSQGDALFLTFIFGKEFYMFRTDLLSIVRSLNTVYTEMGSCHAQILKGGKITSVYTCTF
jgi:hypothetical protein